MDAKKFRDPLLATVAKKTIPAAVRRASAWALLTASGTVVNFALGHAGALWLGMLCCALLQAAAAALALQLRCCRRRFRRALAYLALVVTFVGHCMYAAAVRLLLAADPGYVFARIICTSDMVIFAGGDLLSFLGLLLGGDN